MQNRSPNVQLYVYLEAFSRRLKTVFKKNNCPEAALMPQPMRCSNAK